MAQAVQVLLKYSLIDSGVLLDIRRLLQQYYKAEPRGYTFKVRGEQLKYAGTTLRTLYNERGIHARATMEITGPCPVITHRVAARGVLARSQFQ